MLDVFWVTGRMAQNQTHKLDQPGSDSPLTQSQVQLQRLLRNKLQNYVRSRQEMYGCKVHVFTLFFFTCEWSRQSLRLQQNTLTLLPCISLVTHALILIQYSFKTDQFSYHILWMLTRMAANHPNVLKCNNLKLTTMQQCLQSKNSF